MKRLLYATAAILTPAAWLAAASAGYLAIQQRMDLFAFPYAQWAEAAPWWRYTPWTTFAIAASAAAPTAALALLAYAAIRRPRKKLVAPSGGGLKPLERGVTDNHGHARWATEKELVERFGKPQGLLIGAVERGGGLLHDPCTDGPTHSLVFAGPGSYKAQPLDARVLTPTGFRLMGDLHPGDLVQSPDGSVIPIVGVFPQGVKDVYRVTFSDGRYVECCEDHLWKVWSRTWVEHGVKPSGKYLKATQRGKRSRGWRVAPLAEIRQRMEKKTAEWARTAVPLVSPFAIEFPPSEVPIPPYAMGALLGDGHFAGSISLSTADPFILDRVLSDLPDYRTSLYGKQDYRFTLLDRTRYAPSKFTTDRESVPKKEEWTDARGKPHRSYLYTRDGVTKTIAQWARLRGVKTDTVYQRIFKMGWTTDEALGFSKRKEPNTGCWSPLHLALEQLGLQNTRSHTKFIPEIYKRGSAAQRVALMQGLLDTDGHVGNGTHAVITSTSQQLALDIQEVAWSLGAIASITPHQPYCTYKGVYTLGKPAWRVLIVHPDIQALFSLPRKVAECKTKNMRHRLRITSIDHVGRKPTQCIKVGSDEGLYITDNYIVTHNTTTAVSRIWNWSGPAVIFDPSLEIGPVMTEALEARGYRVTTIALDGSGIDALDWINPRNPEAEVHIRTAVDAIYDEGAGNRRNAEAGNNPFWSTWGRSLIACLMAHMLYSDGPKNLRILREDLISTPESEMQPLLETISRNSPSTMARDIARGLMGMKATETFSGIYSNAFAATEWLATKAYADLLSRPSIKTSDILQPNSVVFIQTKMATLQATPAIGRAIISSLMNALYQADGNVEERILFLFDEAWLLRRMKEIELAFATARKYRGTVQLMYQSEGQMEGIWGRDGAKMLRDSSSWRSYSAIQDGEVAERLSRDIGEYGVLAYSEGDNTGRQTQLAQAFGSKSTGRNTNVHEIKRRLVLPAEILRAEPDEMFVLARGVPHPIKCHAAPYFRYPEIARKMGENRFARVG